MLGCVEPRWDRDDPAGAGKSIRGVGSGLGLAGPGPGPVMTTSGEESMTSLSYAAPVPSMLTTVIGAAVTLPGLLLRGDDMAEASTTATLCAVMYETNARALEMATTWHQGGHEVTRKHDA